MLTAYKARNTGGDPFRNLMAAVINRAIDDLGEHTSLGPSGVERDQAMAFILGEDCEAYCQELGIDHEAVKEQAAALYRQCLDRESNGPGRIAHNAPPVIPYSVEDEG